MNKKILLVFVVFLLLGGGYFLMNRQSAPGADTQFSTNTKTETGTGTEPEAPNSLKDLLTSTNSQKCTFASTENGTTSEGTVYVSGGKVRTDSKITTSGKTMTTSMFTDGKTLYMWGDQLGTQGIKITIEASETATPVSGGAAETDLNDPMNFNCAPWAADLSTFDLPGDITFTETAYPNFPPDR